MLFILLQLLVFAVAYEVYGPAIGQVGIAQLPQTWGKTTTVVVAVPQAVGTETV